MKELHFAFKPHGLLLTAAGFPSNMVIEAGYDIPALDKYLDYVSIMAYDYYWLGGGLRRSTLIMGEFTMARGFSAYYEICDLVHNKGWKVVHDQTGSMGSYAYKDTQWVSFDDSK